MLPSENIVVRVQACDLVEGPPDWPFANEHGASIDAHWQRRCRANPALFNGRIFVLSAGLLNGEAFAGTLQPVDFKSFLYWKEEGYPDTHVRDCFGSALIRSADGHILLGRQRAGNINAGLSYLPGGFIDPRDVLGDGRIDIAASILRETAEETGLCAAELTREPGFILTFAGPMLSIAAAFFSPLAAAELTAKVRSHIAKDQATELEDAVTVRQLHDLDALTLPAYAQLLLPTLLPA